MVVTMALLASLFTLVIITVLIVVTGAKRSSMMSRRAKGIATTGHTPSKKELSDRHVAEMEIELRQPLSEWVKKGEQVAIDEVKLKSSEPHKAPCLPNKPMQRPGGMGPEVQYHPSALDRAIGKPAGMSVQRDWLTGRILVDIPLSVSPEQAVFWVRGFEKKYAVGNILVGYGDYIIYPPHRMSDKELLVEFQNGADRHIPIYVEQSLESVYHVRGVR
jgi:hypothetical protein